MTHTSQRRGLDPARTGEDIVVLAMISRKDRGIEGIRTPMKELAAKMLEHGRGHWPKRTNDRLESWAKGGAPMTMAVTFSDATRVAKLLEDLAGDWRARNREKGYPVSVVLSGLVTDTHAACQKAGLTEHTHLHSLGFFGQRVHELPTDDELAVATMCGHGLIAAGRIRNLVQSIKAGELTPKEAADDVALPCLCGIGNMERAEGLFRKLALD